MLVILSINYTGNILSIFKMNNSASTYVLAVISKLNKKAFYSAFNLKDCIIVTNSHIEKFDQNDVAYIYE